MSQFANIRIKEFANIFIKLSEKHQKPSRIFFFNGFLIGYPRNNAYFAGWKEANSITNIETTLEEHPLQLMMEFQDSSNVVIECDGVTLVTITPTKVLFGDGTDYFQIPTDASVVLCTIFIDKDHNLCVICESQEAKFDRYHGCYRNDVPLTAMTLNPEKQDIVYFRSLHSLDSKQGK